MVGNPMEREGLPASLFLTTLKAWIIILVLANCFQDLLFAQIGSPPTTRSASEDQDYAFAHGLFQDKLYQLSLEQFENYLKKYPSSIRRQDALFLRAECSYHLSLYADAIVGYQSLIREYGKGSLTDDGYFRIGQSYLALERPSEALQPFKTVVDQFAGSPLAGEAAYWLGEAYFRLKEPANAVKYYTLSYEFFSGNPYRDYALYSIGWTYQSDERYTDAVAAYSMLIDSISASPLVSAARVRIGECWYGTKEYAKAADVLIKSLTSITGDLEKGQAQFLIAESHYRLGEYSQARRDYEKLLNDLPRHPLKDDALYGLGWTFLQSKNYESAASTFQRVADGKGKLAHAARYRQATALRLRGLSDQSLQVYDQVTAATPQGEFSDNAHMDKAEILLDQGKVVESRLEAEKVVASFTSSDVRAEALRLVGECLLREGRPTEARKSFELASVIPGVRYEVKVAADFQAAWAAYRSGSFDTAAIGFGAFVREYPKHPKAYEAMYWQAEAEYKKGDHDRSLELYRQVLASQRDEKRTDAQYGLGWSLYKLGKYADAAGAFERMVQTAPRGPLAYDARLRQADALFALKDNKRAGAAYRAAIRLYPDSASNDYAMYQAGQCSFRDNDVTEAYKQFSQVVRQFSSSPLADDAQYAMGWVNFHRKDFTEAIKEFQKVIRNFPTGDAAPRAYYSMGDCYYNLEQYAAAEKSYREVLARFPDGRYMADAVTGIQYCLLAQGKEKEAYAVFDRYIREHPGSKASQELHLKKADLYYNQKKYTEAALEYKGFVASYSSSPLKGQAAFWLGKSLVELKNPDEAAKAFEQSADLPGSHRGLALLEAVDLALAADRSDKAFELVSRGEKVFTDGESQSELRYRKGRIFMANGNPGDARRQFMSVVDRYPGRPAADRSRVAMVRLDLAEGKPESARPLAESVASSRSDEVGAEAQYLVGETYAAQKNWKLATSAYLRVRYVYPSYQDWIHRSMLGLGRSYAGSGDLRRARETYKDLLGRTPAGDVKSEAETRLKELDRS